MFQAVIHRAALGRAAQIGALYDVRTESFVHDSIFRSKLDGNAIDTIERGDTSVELVMLDSIQDRFDKFNIEAELQVSLLAGLVEPSGSGAYLKEEKKSARTQSMSLIYKIRTIYEELILRQNKDKIDTEMLTAGGKLPATHVVVAINWGAVCLITCESENTEGKDGTIVKGMLKAELEKMKSLVDPKALAKVDFKDFDTKKVDKFTFKCKSDVSLTDTDLPSTFEGALNLAKSLPKLVKKTNGAKGVPLIYMLLPLDAVVDVCRLPVTLQLHIATIKEDVIKRCAQVLESITEKRQRLFDIKTDLHAVGKYIADDTLDTINQHVNEIEMDVSSFRAELKELVAKIRRGDEDVSALDAFLTETSDSLPKYTHYIRLFQADLNKLDLIKSWKDRGIVYLSKNDQLTGIKDDQPTVYVLYKPKSNTRMTRSEQNEDFFLKYQKTHSQQSGTAFKVVDEAVSPHLWPSEENKATIKFYENGVKTFGDLFEEEGRDTEMCLIKHSKTTGCRNKPSERALVKIRCPNAFAGNKKCSRTPIIWKCADCKKVVEYGLKTCKFYCDCGKSEPSSKSRFRCNENVHGIDYMSFPVDLLRKELCSLRVMPEKNILILGETGVGKSTWINGIVNYLNYATFDEAKEAKTCHCLIPSQFIFTDNGESVEIKVGEESNNEIHQVGHSATQATRAYIFPVGDQKIHLIDTPGIGDSRGFDEDRKNFDNILAHLSYYDEIHAVCILLKPNNSRLTLWFQFCIQELLTRLDTSAKDNIVFCFTNALGTFYKPGDTLPALNKMLREKNIGITANPDNYFCFDNQSFRFLACLHNGIEFNPEDIKTYAESWNKALAQTKKLFDQINSMVPHKVKNTISMNEARRVIVAMSKPMAEVANTIQENMQIADDAKQQIDLQNRGMADLEKNLRFTGIDLIREELDYPKTVCTHSDCIESITVGENNIEKTDYKQDCHSPCYLEGIPTETTKDYRLQGCSCITGTSCQQCGHDYSVHMHITYTLNKVSKDFISKDVQKKIMAKQTEKEQKEEFKRCVDKTVAELQSEELTILRASAKYGSYLKKHALIPYNDTVDAYLDMHIKQEKDNKNKSRGKNRLKRLRNLKTKYKKEQQALDDALQSGETTTPEEIMQLQQQLFKLKHFGRTLKGIFDGISISRLSRNMRFQQIVAPVDQRGSTGGFISKVLGNVQAAGAWAIKGMYNLMPTTTPTTEQRHRRQGGPLPEGTCPPEKISK